MSVTVSVTGGPTATVAWTKGMNAQAALEAAWKQLNPVPSTPPVFSYAMQYFGSMGYLVTMMNETYETYSSSATPNFYWEFYYQNEPAIVGIDGQILNDGDRIMFAFESYDPKVDRATSWKKLKHG